MKVGYLTSIDIDLKVARANQVKSMFRAFREVLEGNFFGCSLTNNNENLDYISNVSVNCSGKIRKFICPFIFLPLVLKNGIGKIYCREIFIALIYSILGKKVIFELHEINDSITQHLSLKFLHLFNNFHVVTVSQKALDDLKLKYKGINGKVLPNGVFVEDYESLWLCQNKFKRELLASYNGKYIFVYTGSLYKGNDADIIFNLAKLYNNYSFVCIGDSTEKFSLIKDRFSNTSNVFHVPSVAHDEAIKYQIAADVLIYPISSENKIMKYTSPLKIFEYMASKRPIVASSLGSVNEILSKDVCYLFELNDQSMRNAIENVILDLKNLNYERPQNAYNKVLKYHSWKRRIQHINQLFQED